MFTECRCSLKIQLRSSYLGLCVLYHTQNVKDMPTTGLDIVFTIQNTLNLKQ